jgi:protein-S-isoprenylcysteine O-methyltransferase Ste14
MTPEHTIYALWCAWVVSWTVARLWSNRSEKRDGIGAELFFRVLLYVGAILLFAFPPSLQDYAQTQLWHFGDSPNWMLVALTAGLLFTWWARIHLGRLWSDLVVKKAGHHVVDTGPYRLVRHPDLSGPHGCRVRNRDRERDLIRAARSRDYNRVAFYTKALREERFLRAELGEDAYDAYARKTATMAPFVTQSDRNSQ